MDTLQNMKQFLAVVEAGSFTAAAQICNTSTAATSRAVSDLEAHLRTRLLHRSTRKLALTEAGSRYFASCKEILERVYQAEAAASAAHAQPHGQIRMHSTGSFGQHYLVPAIAEYVQLFPNVSFDLTISSRIPDLIEERYDLSLQLADALPDSQLVSQRLGCVHSVLCASPAYLARHGIPMTLADLGAHTCLRMTVDMYPVDEWDLSGPQGQDMFALPATSPLRVNSAEALAVAAFAGLGIVALPAASALAGLRAGTLIRVLPEHELQRKNVYVVYPSRQYLDAKVRTWIEFLQRFLPGTLASNARLTGSGLSCVEAAAKTV
ncbi:MAG: LysR family transcriptional regulator [Janthinobacterium lividum]